MELNESVKAILAIAEREERWEKIIDRLGPVEYMRRLREIRNSQTSVCAESLLEIERIGEGK